MEFKQLDLQPKGNFFQRTWRSAQFRRTLLAMAIGSVAGGLFFILMEGMHMEKMPYDEVVKSMIIGALFGIFFTNSPCARGRC